MPHFITDGGIIKQIKKQFVAVGGSGDAWTPALLSGLTAWLDAEQITGLSDGQAVTAWADVSDNGFSFTAPGTAPIFKANAQGGKPAVLFDGAGSPLVNASVPVNSSVTIYAVGNFLDGAGYRRLIDGLTDFRMFIGRGESSFTTFVGNGAAWNDTAVNSPALPVGAEFNVLGIVNDGASLLPYHNGTVQTAKGGAGAAFSGLSIGGSFVSQEWDGHLAEMVVVDAALSTGDRQRLEGYLAHKWGLQASLPAGHPYKTAAPIDAGLIKEVKKGFVVQGGIAKQFYPSDFDPATPVGTFVEGGYYGGNIVDGGQTFALIFAPASAEISAIWGPFSTMPGTTSTTNGMANTLAMIADTASSYPAGAHCYNLVINGKDDWYLPAKDELNVGFVNRASMPAEGAFNLTGVYYWSSTDAGGFSAWRQQFSTGTQGGSSRGTAHNVRPVRRVLIPA